MNEEKILEILNNWNIWNNQINSGKDRKKYLDKIIPYMDRKEILVLKGIRRCGKSTIMKQLIKYLTKNNIRKEQILYLNLEDYNFSNNLNLELFNLVLNTYKKNINLNKKIFFFIDEIQVIPNWEKWIRTMYDLDVNIKFIISGSCASLLSKELSTLLTGRNICFEVYPLEYSEFVDFSSNNDFENYLKYGGFPEVVLEKDNDKKIKILKQYFEDILYKDIVIRYNIRNSKQLFEITKFIVSNPGTRISINKLSKTFGFSKEILKEYINYLIDSYLLLEIKFFSFSLKVKYDVSKLPKLYSIDNGFINIVTTNYFKNRGNLFENTIASHLKHKSDNINYWSDGNSEVDFIFDKEIINVTSTDKIPEREYDGLNNFLKKNKGFDKILITNNNNLNFNIDIKKYLLR